jgi:hypothetical protein
MDKEIHKILMHCNDCPVVSSAYDQRRRCRERDEQKSDECVALLRFENRIGNVDPISECFEDCSVEGYVHLGSWISRSMQYLSKRSNV